MSGIRIVGFVIRSVMMGMIAAIFLFLFFPELLKPITEPQPEETATELIIESYADIIEQVSDSIVNIRRFNIDRNTFSPTRGNLRVSGGSGVIISDVGYIVTNYHVVAGAEELTVELRNGRTEIPQVIGYDEATDLAVLKINLDNLSFPVINSAISSSVGDVVFAIGYPFGVGQVSTMGIVSSMGSQFRVAEYEDYIYADVSTFPGNSGGALINTKGDLIGIVSSRIENTTMSFAISTKLTMDVVEQIVENGRVIRGWLGFSGSPLNREDRERYGDSSYLVNGITLGGPADQAGLRVDDIVTALDGKTVATAIDMHQLIASIEPGKTINLDIIRQEQKLSLEMLVAERPESSNRTLNTLNR